MSESFEEWSIQKAIQKAIDSGKCEGIMAAYDVLRDRLDETDRKILLDMARDALMGKKDEA